MSVTLTTAETLDCGHAPTPTYYAPGSTATVQRADGTMEQVDVGGRMMSPGWGQDPETGERFCYPCAGRRELAAMLAADTYTGYLDGRTVTNWTGGHLARVTAAWDSRPARRTYVRAVTPDGAEWYGSGPLESGTYVTLHRRAGVAGKARKLAGLTARRATADDAARAFMAGARIIVAESDQGETLEVGKLTTTNGLERGSWDQLAADVATWRNRYPGQTYYVVPRA